MDGGDFILDVGPIFGKAAGDVEELAGDDVSDCADDGEGEDACNCDCEDARDAAGLKAADGGGQQKREREGEGEGDEKLAGEVQDQDGDREHEKGSDPGQLGASRKRHKDLAEPDEWSGLSGQEYIKAVDAGANDAEIERV